MKKIYEKHRNNKKSYKKISKLFWEIINNLKTGKTIDDTIQAIISTNDFNYLTINAVNQNISTSQRDFKTNSKSEIYIKDTLPNAPRCKICNGFIHKNSISIDHKQRKQDSGLANIDNGQLTHPYCNTGYKN